MKTMKPVNSLFILMILIGLMTSCQDHKKSTLTLLSNQIPTDIPLVFGAGIISTDDFEFAITFSPKMDEIFFTRRKEGEKNNIYAMKFTDGEWSRPEIAFFSSNDLWDFEPHINPKGDMLYFGTNKQLSDTVKSSGIHEWYVEKKEGSWSEPMPLPQPFVEDRFVMYVTSSNNGNLYFNSMEEGAKRGSELSIYHSLKEDGEYTSFKKMGKAINTGSMVAHPYIAPDESYMIFDAEKSSGFGDCDLYISFQEKGVWSEAYNLGAKINTAMCEMTPSVSPDGKYLFFHQGEKKTREDESTYWLGNIYWVDFVQLKKEVLKQQMAN